MQRDRFLLRFASISNESHAASYSRTLSLKGIQNEVVQDEQGQYSILSSESWDFAGAQAIQKRLIEIHALRAQIVQAP